MSTERELRAALALVAAGPCLLCGGPSSVVWAFIPHPAHAHVFEGDRVLLYGLCPACHADAGAPEAAEELLEDWGRAA